MPTVQFFACDACETVYAEAERHQHCRHCDAPVEELTGRGGAAAYFAPIEEGPDRR